MKTDPVENFVRNHASDFDDLIPPAQAWNEIASHLPAQKPGVLRRMWPVVWKVAAAIVLFASAWLLHDVFDSYKSGKQLDEVANSSYIAPGLPEVSDAEAYYITQISNKQTELQAYTRQHPEIIEELKQEFSEIDTKNAELKNDLVESNANEKVIEAIILSYKVKIEILDQILAEMRETRVQPATRSAKTNL